MKTIDIKTTQNVSITYELASARDRVLAFLIDLILKVVLSLLLFWGFYIVASDVYFSDSIEYFYLLIILPISSFYTLAFELLMQGQTPGKRLLKIRVVKLDGKRPLFYDYLLRWTFRIVDIWLSFGVFAVILSSSSDYAQRLGDLVSNCTLVKVYSKPVIELEGVRRIDTRESYKPQYLGITNFRESDIVLIKTTIERYGRYRNKAHKEALIELSQLMAQKLEIEPQVNDHLKFLKTLVTDYVVLTR